MRMMNTLFSKFESAVSFFFSAKVDKLWKKIKSKYLFQNEKQIKEIKPNEIKKTEKNETEKKNQTEKIETEKTEIDEVSAKKEKEEKIELKIELNKETEIIENEKTEIEKNEQTAVLTPLKNKEESKIMEEKIEKVFIFFFRNFYFIA